MWRFAVRACESNVSLRVSQRRVKPQGEDHTLKAAFKSATLLKLSVRKRSITAVMMFGGGRGERDVSCAVKASEQIPHLKIRATPPSPSAPGHTPSPRSLAPAPSGTCPSSGAPAASQFLRALISRKKNKQSQIRWRRDPHLFQPFCPNLLIPSLVHFKGLVHHPFFVLREFGTSHTLEVCDHVLLLLSLRIGQRPPPLSDRPRYFRHV